MSLEVRMGAEGNWIRCHFDLVSELQRIMWILEYIYRDNVSCHDFTTNFFL